ncbi:MAG: sigma 54-interacting transcriptional regulator [Oscillospiraceae bacterium]|nr:sigma 54-interacting transcriptional regulator [Oscillospiraceae bacterium]
MEKIVTSVEEMQNISPMLKGIMDFAFDESCIMDKDGYIIHCSESSPLIWGRPNSESIGRHITELDSASPYPELLATGKPVLGKLHIINGMTCITHMIPLFDREDKIIGAFGVIVFRGIEKLKKLMRDQSFDANDTTSKNLYDQLSRAEAGYSLSEFIGQTPDVLRIKEMCKRFAKSEHPVLIRGETGCGKEILASGIHTERFSKDKRPFVKINCTAIPENLLESELFGYEKGAFSGAYTTKRGKFEIAGGGTILLDEIGDLDVYMQSKLLRVIEDKEFERLGGNTLIPLRARIIASTNCDLESKIEQGKFRKDLYYRLSVLELNLPPLRERREDIPLMVNHFLRQAESDRTFSKEAMEILETYDWPGNVRQLRNLVMKLTIMVPDSASCFSAADVRAVLDRQDGKVSGESYAAVKTISDMKKDAVVDALKACGYCVSDAAKLLGVSRGTMYNRIKRYNIDIDKTIK